jgi:hypothetical protein
MVAQAFSSEIRGREIGTRGKRQWTLDGDINGRITLEQYLDILEQFLFRTSLDVLKEERAKGFPEDFITITDNQLGKPAREVNARKRGRIEYNAGQTVSELINFIFKEVLLRSPVDTGVYKRSHILLYNAREVADNIQDALKWADQVTLKQGDIIELINVQPYARKLERLGVTAQARRPRSRKASKKSQNLGFTRVNKPNGVYFLTAQLAKKTFGPAVGSLKFEYRQGEGAISSAAQEFSGKSRRSTFKRDGRPYLYPTIIVRVDQRGFRT